MTVSACPGHFWKSVKAFTVVVGALFFILNTFPIFQKFISRSSVVASSNEPPSDGLLPLPTIFLCNETGYADEEMYGSIEEYYNKSLDPWVYIMELEPNNTMESTDVWEITPIYTLYRGQCVAIKYKPEVCI